MRKPIKLVAFDLDGVLVDGGGSWVAVHRGLGTLLASQANGSEFFSGKISFEEWAKKDVALWKGVEIEKLSDILGSCKLMDGIDETLPKLREKYRIAIISGGLKMLADRLKETYRLDYSFGNELVVTEGKVAGIKHTVDFGSKGEILRKLAADMGISAKQCAAVGDYLNDIPMFQAAGYSIAFNPKNPEVAESADEVVYEKDLRRILDFL